MFYRIIPSKYLSSKQPVPNYSMTYDMARNWLKKIAPSLQIYYHILPKNSDLIEKFLSDS